MANAIDLAANTRRMDDNEQVGGRTHHFDRYPASGSQYSSVSQSHRDGGAAAAMAWRDDDGKLAFHVDVVPHGDPLQGDPEVRPGRYIYNSMSDIIEERDGLTTSIRQIADHGFGDGWQAFEARQKYDGGGTLRVNFLTDVEPSDMLAEPWVGNDEGFDRTILLDDIPATPSGQDYQTVLVPEGGVTGSLDGDEGRFTCSSCTLVTDLRARPAGYYPVGGDLVFTPDDGSEAVVVSASPSEKVPDADYLSFGNWRYVSEYVSEDDTDVGAYEFGVFAGGGDPFEVTNLMALTGTATYNGDTTGMYYTDRSSSRPHFGSFDADVELTADFGTGSEFGTIDGKVYNFEFEGDASSFPTELSLETASSRNTEGTNIFQSPDEGGESVPGGWIFGDASGSADDTSWWGRWSGKFFGNGVATTAEHPGSVGGTFGATNGESGLAGSFGAYLVEPWSLPLGHGLASGRFTVEPGATEEHGNIFLSCPAGGRVCVVTVTADGTAFYGKRGGKPVVQLARPEEFYGHFTQAPIVDLNETLHVGADVAPPAGQLTAAGTHDGVNVSHGRALDGVGADEVIAYIEPWVGVGEFKDSPGLQTFSVQPVVRIAEGTSDEFTDYAVRAVQLINAALPHEKRMVFGNAAPPLAALEDVPDGEIFIDIVPWEDWNDPRKSQESAASAQTSTRWHFNLEAQRWEVLGARASHIWYDPVHWKDRRLEVLVHELIHSLGMAHHADPIRFPNSIMKANGGVPGHVLSPIDREALLAAYSRLDPGDLPNALSSESFGAWNDTSVHVRGDIDIPGGDVAFGVALRNGLAQPWAFGPMPGTDLADNHMLSGTVTWSGRLLAFTPIVEVVGGAADLAVDLGTLDGQLDFTNLEYWGANAAPGQIGTGTIWSDGDLGYTISVRGNTFVQTGGDEGIVTGAFFGAAHEAMGGALERTDLTASFGGTR